MKRIKEDAIAYMYMRKLRVFHFKRRPMILNRKIHFSDMRLFKAFFLTVIKMQLV